MPLASAKGSDAYTSLRYQLSAIDAAQEGLDEFDANEESNKNLADLTSVMSGFLKGAETLHDHFSCGAFIVGKWNPTTERERSIRLLLIASYNSLASDVTRRIAFAKNQFIHPSRTRSRAQNLREAETSAAIDSDMKKAQTQLLEMTGYSLALAVDLSDPSAETTQYMVLSCSERDGILTLSESSKRDEASDYEKAAGLIHRSLADHQCRR